MGIAALTTVGASLASLSKAEPGGKPVSLAWSRKILLKSAIDPPAGGRPLFIYSSR